MLTGLYMDVKRISTEDNTLINQYYYSDSGGKKSKVYLRDGPLVRTDGFIFIPAPIMIKVLQVTTALVDGKKR